MTVTVRRPNGGEFGERVQNCRSPRNHQASTVMYDTQGNKGISAGLNGML